MIDKNKMTAVHDLLDLVDEFNGSKYSEYMAEFNLFNRNELRIQFVRCADSISAVLAWHMKLNDLGTHIILKCSDRIRHDINRLKDGISMSEITRALPTDGIRVDIEKFIRGIK